MTVSKTVHVGSTPATPAKLIIIFYNIDINGRLKMDLDTCLDPNNNFEAACAGFVNACNDVQLLNILNIFKSIIQLITILVPVILVIFVIIDIIKTISAGDVDTKKLSKSIAKRIAAAVIVFLVYPIVNFVLQITPLSNSYYISCYNHADQVLDISTCNACDAIKNLNNAITTLKDNQTEQNYAEAMRLYEVARQEVKLITKKGEREEYQKKLTELKNDIAQLQP